MSELTDLITAVGILTAVSTGSIMLFVEWRCGKICKDVQDFKDYFEAGLRSLGARFDQHIDRRVD